MKKTTKKLNSGTKTKKLHWYTADQVFKKVSKTKEFESAHKVEQLRIRIAHKIREVRVSQKLTQETVAQRASMPQSVIARLESGEHSVSVETLSRIASALGKNVEIV